MLKPPTCRETALAAVSIGALLLFATSTRPSSATSIAGDPDDDWARMEEALFILRAGDPAAKREVAENAESVFDALFEDDPEHDDEDVARAIASLRSLVRIERDDWISYRLLTNILELDEDLLQPLFLDALKDSSPNLNGVGVRWFSEHTSEEALPELEDIWVHDERPWVRAELMIALVRHGSRDHGDEFLRLARGKDGILASAAIRALTIVGDPQVIPILATIVRTSRSNTGLLALDALARWPDSREVLEAALEASRSPRPDFQRHAAEVLGTVEDPAAAARLFTLATGRGDPNVRSAALGGLKGTDPAALVPLTLEILRETPTPENAPLHSAAIGVLRYVDDPSVLPRLAGLEFGSGDSRFHELVRLRWYLARERDGTSPRRRPVSHGTSDLEVYPEEEEEERIALAPPPAMLTVRCWEYPDVPGDPRKFPRLPAGKEGAIVDHFERDEESWVQVDAGDCWVPERFTGPRVAPMTPGEKEEESMFIRREFDLPAEELESDVAQGLMDAGLLEVIEPGDEVIGVAMSIDPEDFDRVLLLSRSCGLNETMLDGEIYDLVADLAPLYRGHPVLDRFRRPPLDDRGETDEAIDLDILELTDR